MAGLGSKKVVSRFFWPSTNKKKSENERSLAGRPSEYYCIAIYNKPTASSTTATRPAWVWQTTAPAAPYDE